MFSWLNISNAAGTGLSSKIQGEAEKTGILCEAYSLVRNLVKSLGRIKCKTPDNKSSSLSIMW